MTHRFLLPGNIALLTEPGSVTTILGSCIAVIIYDHQACIGAMNHYLLPRPSGSAASTNRLKYGIYAIPDLIALVTAEGSSPRSLVAEIYGGASVVSELSRDFSIGSENAVLAAEILGKERIPVKHTSIGGAFGRKIEFAMPSRQVRERFIKQSISA